jgi:hypothetical protein
VTRLALALLVGWLALPAFAWDDFGHMEVAAVAYPRLTPAARARAAALLKLNPSYRHWIHGVRAAERERVAFLRAATWPDAIKSDSRYDNDQPGAPAASQNLGYADRLRHKYWHYVDLPFSPDGTALVAAPVPNAATQIAAFRAVLAAQGASDDVKSYDLAWLLHLVGDLHQPLHCAQRFDRDDPRGDRGGNTVKITDNESPALCDDPRFCPFGPASNLHAFWDDVTGSSYSAAAAQAAAEKLPAPPPTKAAIQDEQVWLREGLSLAQSDVYAKPIGVGHGPFAIDPAYQKNARALAKKRIALAGARLANLLNQAFAAEAARD